MPLVFSSASGAGATVVDVVVVAAPRTVVVGPGRVGPVVVAGVAVVVVSKTCSGAPAKGSSPVKILRTVCMFSPLIRGMRTALLDTTALKHSSLILTQSGPIPARQFYVCMASPGTIRIS